MLGDVYIYIYTHIFRCHIYICVYINMYVLGPLKPEPVFQGRQRGSSEHQGSKVPKYEGHMASLPGIVVTILGR